MRPTRPQNSRLYRLATGFDVSARHTVKATLALCALGMGLGVVGCKDEPAAARVAPPSASAQAPQAPQAVHLSVNSKSFARFLIDAPLEKIKGHADKLRGEITVDPADLTSTRGEIDVDLAGLITETFDDASKNTAQTGHARNWLEIGADVAEKQREENRFARFTIQSVEGVVPQGSPSAEGAQNVDARRSFVLAARGALWIHGASVPKSLKLTAEFEGPKNAPTSVHVTTVEPLTISLREHDIKPRDVAGKFLRGALEQVGQKLDDKVQVSLDVTAQSGKI